MTKIIRLLTIFLLVLNFNNHQTSLAEGEEAEPVLKGASFDKETGIIAYELAVPSWVRIRIGIGDGPLYRTICDWEKRDTGKHEEKWDGMDPSGRFKLIGRKDLAFTFNYFTAGDEYITNVRLSDIQPPAGNLSGRHLPNLKINRLHKGHARKHCHESKIKIKLSKDVPQTKNDLYIIKEKLPIEIDIEDDDWFRSERYSLHIFIDDVFVQGELDGYVPYTWIFDPKDLNEGEHLITINLAGFADHYGIASLPIYVKRPRGIKYVFSKK